MVNVMGLIESWLAIWAVGIHILHFVQVCIDFDFLQTLPKPYIEYSSDVKISVGSFLLNHSKNIFSVHLFDQHAKEFVKFYDETCAIKIFFTKKLYSYGEMMIVTWNGGEACKLLNLISTMESKYRKKEGRKLQIVVSQ